MSPTDAEKKLISRTALPHTMKMDIVAETDLNVITFPNPMGQGPLQLPISGDVLTTRDIPCFYPNAWRKDKIANCSFRSASSRDLVDGQVIQYNVPTTIPALGTSSNSPRGTLAFQKKSEFYIRSNMSATFHGYLDNNYGTIVRMTYLCFDIEGFTCSLSNFGNSQYLINQNTDWELQVGSNGGGMNDPNFVYAYKRFPMQPFIRDTYYNEQIVDYDGYIVLETTRNRQFIGQPTFYPIAGGIPQYFLMDGWVDVSDGSSNIIRYQANYIPGRGNTTTSFGSGLLQNMNKIIGSMLYQSLELTQDQQGITGRNVTIGTTGGVNTPITGTADIDITYDMVMNPGQEYLGEGYLAQGNALNTYVLDPKIFSYDLQQGLVTGRYRYGSSGNFTLFDAEASLKEIEFLHTI